MAKRQLSVFPAQPESAEDISKHTPLQATFELFRQYLQQSGKSEHTVKAFIGDMHLLAEHLGAAILIGQIKTSGLNTFMHWLEYGRGVPCSRKSYARRVTSLKVYFKWLYGLGAIPHDPARAILQRSGPAPLSQVLSPEAVRDAIYAAQNMKRGDQPDYRPEFLFQLLLQTGVKKGEAARLLLTDLDRSNPVMPTLVIRHKVQNVYKERRISVQPDLTRLYDQYAAQYDLKAAIFTCTSRNLEYILTDIGEEAGIPFKLSFEVMRWTSAVRDYRDGVDEDSIREKLGLSRTSWYETGSKIRQLVEMQISEENGA